MTEKKDGDARRLTRLPKNEVMWRDGRCSIDRVKGYIYNITQYIATVKHVSLYTQITLYYASGTPSNQIYVAALCIWFLWFFHMGNFDIFQHAMYIC